VTASTLFLMSLEDVVQAVTPPVIGALIALSGTITLFWLQQAASRRQYRRERLDDAFDRVLVLYGQTAQLMYARAERPLTRWESMELMARLLWALPRRDQEVGAWVIAVMTQALNERKNTDDSDEVVNVFSLVLQQLTAWRNGKVKTAWFREEMRGHVASRAADD